MAFKKINLKDKTFYIFEISSTKFLVLDSEMDEPLYYGSWNMTSAYIRTIKEKAPKAIINYYTKEKSGLLKYNPLWSYVPKP
jgi:hypothetical protein